MNLEFMDLGVVTGTVGSVTLSAGGARGGCRTSVCWLCLTCGSETQGDRLEQEWPVGDFLYSEQEQE